MPICTFVYVYVYSPVEKDRIYYISITLVRIESIPFQLSSVIKICRHRIFVCGYIDNLQTVLGVATAF